MDKIHVAAVATIGTKKIITTTNILFFETACNEMAFGNSSTNPGRAHTISQKMANKEVLLQE
jgi:hypothetical protein